MTDVRDFEERQRRTMCFKLDPNEANVKISLSTQVWDSRNGLDLGEN